MNEEHHRHLSRILSSFIVICTKKYIKGQEEHGDNLWEKDSLTIIDYAIEEAVDQVVYLLSARESLIRERNETLNPNTK